MRPTFPIAPFVPVLLTLVVSACDTSVPQAPPSGLLVEGYLVWPADEYVINVGRPVPLGEIPEPKPEPEARVSLGIYEQALQAMSTEAEAPGQYTLSMDRLPVQADTWYELAVELDDQRLTAVTYFPPAPTGVRLEPDVRSAPLLVDRSAEGPDEVVSLTWDLPDEEPAPHLIQVDHPEHGRTFVSPVHWDGEGTLDREAFPEAGTYQLCLYRTTPDLIVYDQNRQARRLYVAPSNVEGGFGVFAALHGTCWSIRVR